MLVMESAHLHPRSLHRAIPLLERAPVRRRPVAHQETVEIARIPMLRDRIAFAQRKALQHQGAQPGRREQLSQRRDRLPLLVALNLDVQRGPEPIVLHRLELAVQRERKPWIGLVAHLQTIVRECCDTLLRGQGHKRRPVHAL